MKSQPFSQQKLVFCILLSIAFNSRDANSASTATGTGTAKTTVMASITITPVAGSALDFGVASPNDVAKVIAATDATKAQKFDITGQANTAFTITVPASVTMTGPGTAITVNTFTSTPASPVLNASGTLTIGIGATRSAIPANQVAGAYTGAFSVTVSY